MFKYKQVISVDISEFTVIFNTQFLAEYDYDIVNLFNYMYVVILFIILKIELNVCIVKILL